MVKLSERQAVEVVGTFNDGERTVRVTLNARLTEQPATPSAETIHHEVAAWPRVEFAVTADLHESRNGRWQGGGGGQSIDALRLVTDFASGWSAERRDKAVSLCLPDVEDWDASMFAKWATVCEYAAAYVDGIPFSMAEHIYQGEYLPQRKLLIALFETMGGVA